MAANTITIVTVVVATETMVADGFACVIAAQACATAIAADAARMAGITAATMTTAVTTTVTATIATAVTTTTTTIFRVGGTHDGQVSGQ